MTTAPRSRGFPPQRFWRASGAVLWLLAAVLWPRPTWSQPTRQVLLLTDEQQTGVNADSLDLALSLQLQPYDVGSRREVLALPASREDQVRAAHQRGTAAGAMAVVWYAAKASDGTTSVTLLLLDLRRGATVRTMEMGRIEGGIERSMALAARTLLLAQPASTRPARAGPAPAPARPARVALGAGYGVDILPTGDSIRHGPDLALSVSLWRRLQFRLLAGYRLLGGDEIGAVRWSGGAILLTLSAHHTWPVSRRWEFGAGLALRGGALWVEAVEHGGRRELTWLWEIAPGLSGSASVVLWRDLSLELTAILAWVAQAHRVKVQGSETMRSGRVELCVSPLLHYRF